MLATLDGQPQRFRMAMQGGPSIEMSCGDFLTTRQEENDLLDHINLPHDGTALDWGCGVAHHLSRVRQRHPTVHCCGIEICELMRDHCRQTITAPATFVQTFEELPQRQFDLVLLMGNELGVLGSEQGAAMGLSQLVHSLRRGGRIVIESGNPFGHGYCARAFTINWREHQDGPFEWGFSDRNWLSQSLEMLGCTIAFSESHAPGGMFFFAIAQTGEQDGAANGS